MGERGGAGAETAALGGGDGSSEGIPTRFWEGARTRVPPGRVGRLWKISFDQAQQRSGVARNCA